MWGVLGAGLAGLLLYSLSRPSQAEPEDIGESEQEFG